MPYGEQTDLVEALFADGITTRAAATATSGRGVALSALRQAVRDLDGRVEVFSEPGRGTRFVFRFAATPSMAVTPVAGKSA